MHPQHQVYLTQRRKLEDAERQLTTAWTPESCSYACRARLGNPPTFVLNIYW